MQTDEEKTMKKKQTQEQTEKTSQIKVSALQMKKNQQKKQGRSVLVTLTKWSII